MAPRRPLPRSEEYETDLKMRVPLREELGEHFGQYNEIRNALSCVLKTWLSFQSGLPSPELACVLQRDSTLRPLTLYHGRPVYYTIFENSFLRGQRREDLINNEAFIKLTRGVRRALLTNLSCFDFCFVFLHVVSTLLQGIPRAVEVMWYTADVLPRKVYFWDCQIGKERGVLHDFLIITMSGVSYVLDPTGYQFGFPDWFYTCDGYFKNYVNGYHPHYARDFHVEKNRYLGVSAGVEAVYEQKLAEFRQRLLNMTPEEMEESFQGPDL